MLYYNAKWVSYEGLKQFREDDILNNNENLNIDDLQAMLDQMIDYVGLHNIKEIWNISIGNVVKIKHHILLLKNQSHICFCLAIIQCGIIQWLSKVKHHLTPSKFKIKLLVFI